MAEPSQKRPKRACACGRGCKLREGRVKVQGGIRDSATRNRHAAWRSLLCPDGTSADDLYVHYKHFKASDLFYSPPKRLFARSDAQPRRLPYKHGPDFLPRLLASMQENLARAAADTEARAAAAAKLAKALAKVSGGNNCICKMDDCSDQFENSSEYIVVPQAKLSSWLSILYGSSDLVPPGLVAALSCAAGGGKRVRSAPAALLDRRHFNPAHLELRGRRMYVRLRQVTCKNNDGAVSKKRSYYAPLPGHWGDAAPSTSARARPSPEQRGHERLVRGVATASPEKDRKEMAALLSAASAEKARLEELLAEQTALAREATARAAKLKAELAASVQQPTQADLMLDQAARPDTCMSLFGAYTIEPLKKVRARGRRWAIYEIPFASLSQSLLFLCNPPPPLPHCIRHPALRRGFARRARPRLAGGDPAAVELALFSLHRHDSALRARQHDSEQLLLGIHSSARHESVPQVVGATVAPGACHTACLWR
jgi:hypothetical protein